MSIYLLLQGVHHKKYEFYFVANSDTCCIFSVKKDSVHIGTVKFFFDSSDILVDIDQNKIERLTSKSNLEKANLIESFLVYILEEHYA